MKTTFKPLCTTSTVRKSAILALQNGVSIQTVEKQLKEHNILHSTRKLTREVLIQLLDQA